MYVLVVKQFLAKVRRSFEYLLGGEQAVENLLHYLSGNSIDPNCNHFQESAKHSPSDKKRGEKRRKYYRLLKWI
jgi:hypothetical protein